MLTMRQFCFINFFNSFNCTYFFIIYIIFLYFLNFLIILFCISFDTEPKHWDRYALGPSKLVTDTTIMNHEPYSLTK